MTEIIEVIVTGPPKAMPAIVEHVVQHRLAAAGHLTPIESTYWWDGSVNHRTELRATLQTTAPMFDALEAAITELHPYKVPCIAATSLCPSNPQYLQWVIAETRSRWSTDNAPRTS